MPQLLDYATSDVEREAALALMEHQTLRAASRETGISYTTLHYRIQRVKDRAAQAGFAPEHDMTHPVPFPFVAKGVSTYYDSEGAVRGQWVKSKVDDQLRLAGLQAAIAGITKDIPRLDPQARPAHCETALCNLYTMTDCHMGMLAWHKEGGDDWDLEKAETILSGAFEAMVHSAPAASVGIVNQLGDFLHYDGLQALTPTSGHILDADSRFEKMVGAVIRTLRRLVTFALARHDTVHIIMAEGNHDIASSVWLRAIFAMLYENEPRVTVEQSPVPYYVYQHGKTMLGFHHGHLKKKDGLPLLFAARHPAMWGSTTKRYIHTGHYHNEEVKEHAGVKVMQHPTLAAADAYAARGGWMSERQVTCLTYHKDFGQVGSVTIVPEMLTVSPTGPTISDLMKQP